MRSRMTHREDHLPGGVARARGAAGRAPHGWRRTASIVVVLALQAIVPATATRAVAEPAAPAGAAPAERETVSAEPRWTTKLVEHPGKLVRGAGEYLLQLRVPGPAGVGDGVLVLVGERKITGRIQSVSTMTKPGETITVSIRLPDDPGLAAGMDAKLQTMVRDRRVVALPVEAVRGTGTAAAVDLVAASGAIEPRKVQTGEALPGGWVEIVSGVSFGDRVALP